MLSSNLTFIVSKWLRNEKKISAWMTSSTLKYLLVDFLQTREDCSFGALHCRPGMRQQARSPRNICQLARAQRDASEMFMKNSAVLFKPGLPRFHSSNWISSAVSTKTAVPFNTFSSQNNNKIDVALTKQNFHLFHDTQLCQIIIGSQV